MKLARFAKYCWGILVYNLAVILWGAYVRATGSGAGCGSHWPLCNGEVIPRAPAVETVIEFTHRLTSGLALILMIILFVWAFRSYPRGHAVRLGASLCMLLIITEALVGAGLVLFAWVAKDASMGRVISMAVHLVNTFLLLAALSLTAWWASGGKPLKLKHQGWFLWTLVVGLLGTLILGVSGAITALGDTLFPVSTLAEGLKQDFSPAAHFAIRLRIWHPIIAISVGLYLAFIGSLIAMFRPTAAIKRLVVALVAFVLLQLGAGVVNVVMLAPVWMQLAHLLLADFVWITLVLFSANVLVSE